MAVTDAHLPQNYAKICRLSAMHLAITAHFIVGAMACEKRSYSQQTQTCDQATVNPLAMLMTAYFILNLCQTFHFTLLVIFKKFHIQKFLVTLISYLLSNQLFTLKSISYSHSNQAAIAEISGHFTPAKTDMLVLISRLKSPIPPSPQHHNIPLPKKVSSLHSLHSLHSVPSHPSPLWHPTRPTRLTRLTRPNCLACLTCLTCLTDSVSEYKLRHLRGQNHPLTTFNPHIKDLNKS